LAQSPHAVLETQQRYSPTAGLCASVRSDSPSRVHWATRVHGRELGKRRRCCRASSPGRWLLGSAGVSG
jgi:hypothetical protein